jgi:hypothetical protein
MQSQMHIEGQNAKIPALAEPNTPLNRNFFVLHKLRDFPELAYDTAFV